MLETLASHAFSRVADAAQSTGNEVRLLQDAAATYPAWLAAIAGARHYVHLENYIIQDDQAGRMFAEALVAAAARGVRCRVLYDWLGCATRTKPHFWEAMRQAGIEVRRYNPPHLLNPFGWVSRDHRKLLCVDDVVGSTGGLCIGHDWLGDPGKNIAPWRDTAVELRGPAVLQLNAAFLDSWQAAEPPKHQAAEPPKHQAAEPPKAHQAEPTCVETSISDPAHAPDEGVSVSVIAGRPGGMGLYRLEQLVAEIVDESLWLTDGYFVATTFYVRALADAARAGVDVRLLVPGSSNWPLVGALSKSAYRPLLQAGVRVFEWNGPMVHAKTAVADGCWTRIGSSNSNLASWVSNRELDVTIKDTKLACEMQAMFEADMANATEIVLRPGRSGFTGPARRSEPAGAAGRRRGGRLLSGVIGFGNALGATLTQRRTMGAAETLVLLAGGGMLIAFGLLALFTPKLVAYPVGFLALWVAVGFFAHAWKLRQAGAQ